MKVSFTDEYFNLYSHISEIMSTVYPVRIQFKGYQLLYPVSILSVEDVLPILSQ